MKNMSESKSLKKVCEQQGGVKTVDNENLKPVVEMEGLNAEAGEDLSVDDDKLYEGVTDDAEESRTAEYRMITKSDDTVSSQNS